MNKKIVNPPAKKNAKGKLPSGILCDGWLYISGQGPLDVASGKVISGSIEEETLLTLRNIEAIIHEAGADKSAIVKCTCYLADLEDFSGFHASFGEFFGEDLPTRTTSQAGLLSGIRVEIDAVVRVD